MSRDTAGGPIIGRRALLGAGMGFLLAARESGAALQGAGDASQPPTIAVLPFLPKHREMAEDWVDRKNASLGADLAGHVIQALVKRGYTSVCAPDLTQKAVNDLNVPVPKKKGAIPSASAWQGAYVKTLGQQLKVDFVVLPVLVESERRKVRRSIPNPIPLPFFRPDEKRCVRIRAWVLEADEDYDLARMLDGKDPSFKWFEVYRERVVKSLEKDLKGLQGGKQNERATLYSEVGFVSRLAADRLARQLGDYFLDGSGTVTDLSGDRATLDVGAQNGVKLGDAYTFFQVKEEKDADGQVVFEEYLEAGRGEVIEFVARKGRRQGRAVVRVSGMQPGFQVEKHCLARPSRLPVPTRETSDPDTGPGAKP